MTEHSTHFLCGASDSWKHSLLECNMSSCVWALEKEEIVEHLCKLQEVDAHSWLAALMKSVSHDDRARLLVRMWAIWYGNRKAFHENIFQSLLSTHLFITRFMADLQSADTPQAKNVVKCRQSRRRVPPPAALTKVNVDATVSQKITNGFCGSG